MNKVSLAPHTTLYPLPAVLVTSTKGGKTNIITLSWVGVVNSVPPMVSISIRPSRFSHRLVAESGQFAINVPTATMVKVVDFCGTVSGRQVDKFQATGLTPLPGQTIEAPILAECPVNLECAVRQTIKLGSHDMFIGEVLRVLADNDRIKEGGGLDIADNDALAYYPVAEQYRGGGQVVGRYGFTKGKLAK